MLRKCRCGAEDHAQPSGDLCNCQGGDVLNGHTAACRSVEHYVAKEILPVRNLADFEAQQLKRKGYTYSEDYQRPHGFRFTCRGCLRKSEEIAAIQRDLQKARDLLTGGNLTVGQIYTA